MRTGTMLYNRLRSGDLCRHEGKDRRLACRGPKHRSGTEEERHAGQVEHRVQKKGKTTYEIETRVNGKGRDIVIDKSGALLEVEEEVDLVAIPAAAQDALRKRAAGGTIKKVETLTQGSKVSYEAAIMTKAGKRIEAGVNADGSRHKD